MPILRVTPHSEHPKSDAVITVDGEVVGGVINGPHGATVQTGGRIPAIDGLVGESVRDVWGKVVRKGLEDGLQLITQLTIES